MNHQTKKYAIIGSILLLCVISFAYWLHGAFYISTDDAYVNANIVQEAARVTGQVSHLYVKNNQFVKAGDPLFDLDKAPFQVAMDQARAQLDMNMASLKLAQVTAARTVRLEKNKFASLQENDQAQSNLQSAIASVQLGQANLAQAKLNLDYTTITAPTTGWVSNLSLQSGDTVNANQPQFAIISNDEFWVDANFKETELEKLHPGQSATVQVDMYPNHEFKGVIESLSSSSGTAFSLLPPENATGNWVKVSQRVPVRVRIVSTDPKYPLRIGTTATVSIRVNPWSS